MNENIKVNTCPQCGAPIKVNLNSCEYCNAEFIVRSLSYLKSFDKSGINKYISHYKELLDESPDDGEINLSMGICYLNLGLYNLANKFFKKAIDLTPDNSEVYYYYSLSLFNGKRPKITKYSMIQEIENYLNTAIQLDSERYKYYYLMAFIKYDFYLRNGLDQGLPTFEELKLEMENKLKTGEEEIDRIRNFLNISDRDVKVLV